MMIQETHNEADAAEATTETAGKAATKTKKVSMLEMAVIAASQVRPNYDPKMIKAALKKRRSGVKSKARSKAKRKFSGAPKVFDASKAAEVDAEADA